MLKLQCKAILPLKFFVYLKRHRSKVINAQFSCLAMGSSSVVSVAAAVFTWSWMMRHQDMFKITIFQECIHAQLSKALRLGHCRPQ